MEAWLSDVKQMRIPRPKFGIYANATTTATITVMTTSSSGSGTGGAFLRMPRDPPRDYHYGDSSSDMSSSGNATGSKMPVDTEHLRQSLQQKL